MGMAGPRIIAEHVEKATTLKNPQQNNKTGNVQLKLLIFIHASFRLQQNICYLY